MVSCEHCEREVSIYDYIALSNNPLYETDCHYIIHKSCMSSYDRVVEECGDLVLVCRNED